MTSEPTIGGKSISSAPSENGLLDQSIDFNVYTWGKITSINNWRSNTLNDFINCFHGFIAAGYDEYSAFAQKIHLLADQKMTLHN